MPLNHLIRDGDNPDITEERLKSSFCTKQLGNVIYGEEHARRRQEISDEVQRRKQLLDPFPHVFMDRPEKIENAMRKLLEVFHVLTDIVDPTNDNEMAHLMAEVFSGDGFPLVLHYVMFLPAIHGQADEEQCEEWLPKAMSMQWIGTYAQTELGHGTNLKALETTATFDNARDEFVMHTPNVTSMKWWPGNLGKTANMAVVSAQLYTNGVCHGTHNFMVPLRDLDTHEPLPGITVGDIGPKFGINTVDNGFLRLDQVRIPRRNMLMRHAKVSREGVYTKPMHPKVAYGAMVFVRANMIKTLAHDLSRAITIALRYSAVRRQGEITPGKGEVKILDYQTQQHRLLPTLAKAFAYTLTGIEIREIYGRISHDVKKGNADELADLHALLSGMKSVVSHQVGVSIEQCRMACGGHGYSHASGLPEMYGVSIGGCTYEGENMVMLLQLARYLMRAAASTKKGEAVSTMMDFLKKTDSGRADFGSKCPRKLETEFITAFEHIARKLTFSAADRLSALESSGLTKENAWNQNAVEMQRASRAYTRLWIARCFLDSIHRVADKAVKEVLTDLLHLYMSYELVDMSHYLYQDNYATLDQVNQLKNIMYGLLEKIRPNAVSLVDSMIVSDYELRSVLGRRDGNVYDALLKWAQGSPLNKEQVLPAITKYLSPMMSGSKSKL